MTSKYKLDVKGKSKTYHINLLKRYLPREECVEGNLSLFDLVRSNESVEKNEILDSQEPVLGNSVYCDSDRVPDEFTTTIPFPNLLQTESRVDINISDSLKAEQSKQVSQLLERFSGILTDVPLKTNVLQCEIHLTTDDPVTSKPYPVPYTVRSTIRNEVQKMLDSGVIERSDSPYASPVVLILKKDQSVRFCIDYRRINKATIFDPEPIPNPEDLFVQLTESKYFSKIDLSKGYSCS